jgi:hypothetical protein
MSTQEMFEKHFWFNKAQDAWRDFFFAEVNGNKEAARRAEQQFHLLVKRYKQVGASPEPETP